MIEPCCTEVVVSHSSHSSSGNSSEAASPAPPRRMSTAGTTCRAELTSAESVLVEVAVMGDGIEPLCD
jgi:hypothetical protein